jgi:MFS family permease
MPNSVWSPFKHSNYKFFWCCAFASNLGTWIQDVAASWVMTHLSTSPLVISLLYFSSTLPVVLFSIPAGFWADNGNRRKILFIAQGLMMICAFTLGVDVARHQVTEISMLILCFALGVGVALNGPAYQTVLSELVPPGEQQGAVLLYYMGINISRVVGPAIGGFILGFAGPESAFFLNGVSYLGLVIYCWRWPLPPSKAEPLSFAGYFQKITPKDWQILFSLHNMKRWFEMFAVSFCASCLWALYPVRGRIELNLSSLQYGSLLGCLGFGAFLSAVFSEKVMNPQRTKQSLSFAYLIFGAGELVLALAGNYVFACLAMVLAGMGWIILATLMNMSSREMATESHLKATMLGVFLSVFYGGMTLGSVCWGAFAKLLSPSESLLLSAGLLVMFGLYKWRNL